MNDLFALARKITLEFWGVSSTHTADYLIKVIVKHLTHIDNAQDLAERISYDYWDKYKTTKNASLIKIIMEHLENEI